MEPGGRNGGGTGRSRILIVEDVPNVSTVMKARLESYGYEICVIATTGRKAVALALQHRPDLILMDILLDGDMNGIEAAEQIGEHLRVPIIFLSCLNDQEILERAIHVNAYGYILKPYDNVELRFNIENALRNHRTEMERSRRLEKLESGEGTGE
jgi:CheY-like chemotaxis protein